MKLIHHLFLKSYDPDTLREYDMIRTVSVCLLSLFFLLAVILIMGDIPASGAVKLGALMLFILFELILIRQGWFKIAAPLLIISCSLLASFIVFFLEHSFANEIYMLAFLHLFVLFISTLITYHFLYVFISFGMAAVSFILHFLFRSPSHNVHSLLDLENYIACGGILFISFLIIIHIIRSHRNLFEKIENESQKNFKRAQDLESANKKLNRLYEEKRKSDEKYRVLVETATDAIFVAQDGKIKFPNSVTLQLVDYSEKEVLEKEFVEFIHPDDRSMVLERHSLRIIGKEPPINYSFRLINKKGEFLWVQLNSVFILWDGRPATLNYMRDITLQKKLEDQYRQSQKMEAIGRLAGGIAHDFNNILSGIFGYAHLAKENISDQKKTLSNIDQIIKGGGKAAELVRQILTVSRQAKKEKTPIYMAIVIKEALKLIRASIPSTITIKENIYSKKMVTADPAQIHQVVMNLCTNAFHAMMDTGGGTLAVTLKEIEISKTGSIPSIGLPPGEYLKLEISDTGSGIPPEIIKKIFDPYFTTKPVGKGTGLGLAIVSGIVEEHGGHMEVYSEPDQGASFHIFLPVIQEQAVSGKSEIPERIIEGGSETIMIVDDEDDILESACEILENLGYQTKAFQDSSSAFAEFQAHPDRFDLVVTDMTMPSMNGLDLSKKIFEIRPDQDIFLCTGFSEEINKEKALDIGVAKYFEKPLAIDEFLIEVRDTLDQKSSKKTVKSKN